METLSPVEMNRLTKFLESPYFNKNEKLLKIYYSVETHLRDLNSGELKKVEIWNQIYPQVKYEDDKFRKHCSQLIHLIEDWLALEVYLQNPLNKAKHLLEAINNNKIEKLYSSSISSVKLLIQKQNLRPANYYLNIYEIESLFYRLEKIEEQRVEKKSLSNINLELIVNNLDYFYIAEKLKYYTTLLSWSKIVSVKDNILFIKEIIKIAEEKEFQTIPAIAIYKCIYYTYIDSVNEDHYYRLKELINKNLHYFPKEEAKNIVDAAINYAISKSNNREEKYFNELFDLYKYSLDSELLFVNDEISQWTFKNIVTIAIGLKEYSWTENFIQNYSNRLNNKIRENAVTFNLANLHFSNKNFKEVLSLLQKVNYEELYYNLHSKVWLLSSYYELDEYIVLLSLIDSFNIFLKRNSAISKIQKNSYLNFVKFTKKLVYSSLKTKNELINLRNEVNATYVLNKFWLLEKIDEQIAIAKPDPVKKKKK